MLKDSTPQLDLRFIDVLRTGNSTVPLVMPASNRQ